MPRHPLLASLTPSPQQARSGLALAFGLALLLAPNGARADRNLNRPGYTLSWHDEFDGPSLNTAKWNVTVGNNNANNELEYYSAGNVYVDNGLLVLRSDRNVNGGQTTYTSGKVTTAGKFDQLYGWFEWSGQIPYGKGLWPAYWMLSYAGWPPELDVMETIGTSVNCNTMSLHWGPLPNGCTLPWNCGHTENTTFCGPDFSAGFHTFAVDWERNGATFYVDGVPRETAGYLGNCTNTMYLIMNTAVGGDWPGAPDGSTPFPAFNLLDYVRVFQPLAGRYPLLNPSFERGEGVHDFDDWNSYDNGNLQSDPQWANARSGNRALQVWGRYNGQDNTTGIYQDLWAAGGECWQAAVWARNRPGDVPQGANEARLKLEFLDAVGNLLGRSQQTILTNASPTNYQLYRVTAVAPFATARARIVLEYFQSANAAGSVNFDDASLELLWSAPNVLTNGGFENALAGWHPYGASWTNYGVVADRTLALSGSNSFKVYGQFNGLENVSGVYQDQGAVPGMVFTAQGGAYTLASDPVGAGNTAWLEVSFRDAATNFLALYRSAGFDATQPANTWVQLPVTNAFNPVTFAPTGSVTSLVAPPGTAFVRCQVVFYQPASNPQGSVYWDQLQLSQAGAAGPPTVSAVSPNGAFPFVSPADSLTFSVGAPLPLSSNAVQLRLNGLDVSSQLSFLALSNGWAVSLPALAPNTLYTALITVSNALGIVTTNVSFDTFSQTNLSFEAEDFDFSSGQFIDAPVPSSLAATNSYFGRVGVKFVDEYFLNATGSHLYRGADSTATEVAADFLRTRYLAAQAADPNALDYDVGWWATGAWLNYTRTFPTNRYFLYARLAGGNGPYTVRLDQVLSGRGTTQQSTALLGFCQGPGRGWQAWDWVPLLTAAGQPVVLSLGGLTTLRATSSGNVNANFYLLTPAPQSPRLQAAAHGNALTLSVPTEPGFSYTILWAADLAGADWKVLTRFGGDGSAHPWEDLTNGRQRFYKVLVQ